MISASFYLIYIQRRTLTGGWILYFSKLSDVFIVNELRKKFNILLANEENVANINNIMGCIIDIRIVCVYIA